MSLQLKSIEPGDLADIMRLVRTTDWPHTTEDVSAALALGHGVKAIQSQTVIGIAMWWTFGAAAGRMGLIIVDPTSRGTGIGRAITKHAINSLGNRALKLLATEDGRPLYGKMGFIPTSKHQRHQGACTVYRPTISTVRPLNKSDQARVLELDRRATGANRQPVIRHLLDIGKTVVLDNGQDLKGYGVSRSFGQGKVIGPIVAIDETYAIDIFHALLAPGIIRVDRPVIATKFGMALEDVGLFGREMLKPPFFWSQLAS
mgnify:CR=1 FL=1